MCYECINMIGSELATQKFSGVLRVPVAEHPLSKFLDLPLNKTFVPHNSDKKGMDFSHHFDCVWSPLWSLPHQLQAAPWSTSPLQAVDQRRVELTLELGFALL